MNNDHISHHGIKGQKWGVRRYRNSDGSLTESGKKRYDRSEKKHEALKKKVINNPKKLYKHRDQFSEKEINEIISKVEKNQRMKDLGEKEVQRGQRAYQRSVNYLTATAAAVTAIGTIAAFGKKIGK